MTANTTTVLPDARAHNMVPGGYGHGLSHCEYCKATDREIAFALGPVCPNAPTQPAPDAAVPAGCMLTERRLDEDCGCPEEMWDSPWGELHMHLSAGKTSNACLDNGDEGERHIELTTATVDEARAAIFAWAAYPAAAPKVASEGAGLNVDRVRRLVDEVEAGRFDALEAVADKWIDSAGIIRMANAIASVFEKYAPQDVMDRFREKLADMMHLSFVEGAAQVVMQIKPTALATDATDGATGGGEVQ